MALISIASPYSYTIYKFFGKGKGSQLVHITCVKCKGNFVANIMIFNKGVSTIGMITDLSFEDVKKLHNSAPIEVDEAIEGYKRLFIDGK